MVLSTRYPKEQKPMFMVLHKIMKISLNQKLHINEDIYSTELDEEVCIFHATKGEYFNLNSTATFIWKLIEEKLEYQDILKKLVKEYDTDLETCSKEVDTLINNFFVKGILNQSN